MRLGTRSVQLSLGLTARVGQGLQAARSPLVLEYHTLGFTAQRVSAPSSFGG